MSHCNGNQYGRNVTSALPGASHASPSNKPKIRVSVSSLSLTVMQRSWDKPCPFGDFHRIHRGTERCVQGNTCKPGQGELQNHAIAAVTPFILTSTYWEPTTAPRCARTWSNICSPGSCDTVTFYSNYSLTWQFQIILWGGGNGLGVWDEQMSTITYEWINNEVLLYSTGNYISYFMVNHNEKTYEKEYTYITIILLYTRN